MFEQRREAEEVVAVVGEREREREEEEEGKAEGREERKRGREANKGSCMYVISLCCMLD
jgi:hypothetical protein